MISSIHLPSLRQLTAALLLLVTCVSGALAAPPANPTDGQTWQVDSGTRLWDTRAESWVSAESFWLNYATSNGGRFWGRSSEYPNYGDVQEHDTFLVELEQGPCLMYFFHSRWRRAQDVRRWDEAINELEGCPFVFD